VDKVAFYTPKEAAALLKVSERTVRRWIEEGKLPAWRFGRQLRIPAEALEQFGEPAGPKIIERSWAELATDSFAKDWENEKDAEYDRWREHYGVSEG
jgi:excisionase family DNA binding protein